LSTQVIVTGIGGLVCVAALIVVERRILHPILDLVLYGVRLFRTASLIGFLFIACWFALLFLLPLFLQGLRGLSAFESGLATFPQPLGQMSMVQLTSRLYPRIGARRCLIVAMAGMVVTSGLFLLVDLQTSLWWIDVIMFVRGIFIAFAMVSMQTSVFAAVPRAKIGRASSLWNATRQVAAAFGVALAGTVLISRTKALTPLSAAANSAAAQHASLLAFHDALAISGLLAIVALFFAFQVRSEDDAAATHAREQAPALREAVPAALVD
ncbi:MAG TPA: MFS transporter, partial [Chloroflexota bacterium]|nr:MFS transporter [Chloroflexota bacterium]